MTALRVPCDRLGCFCSPRFCFLHAVIAKLGFVGSKTCLSSSLSLGFIGSIDPHGNVDPFISLSSCFWSGHVNFPGTCYYSLATNVATD